MSSRGDWDAATWEGSRRAQIRRGLRLTARERLQALEDLAETSERLAELASRPPTEAVSGSGQEVECDPIDPDEDGQGGRTGSKSMSGGSRLGP